MARFEILEKEGLRLVKATLEKEMIRAESGALYFMKGFIKMESQVPDAGGLFKAMATGESIFRPTYTGTGEIYLEPSFGGFHIMELNGEEWILEDGAYWASEAGIDVDVHREKSLTAFKSGEGLLDFQTKVRGRGQVVLSTPGPVAVVELDGETLTVDGKHVLARPASISYQVQRVTKSLLGSVTSGEGLVRIYKGKGQLLMAPIPYWRQRLFGALGTALAMQASRR